VRLATLLTPNGPRLHVRARSGYVDIAEATGDPRLAAFGSFAAAGLAALDAARGLQDRDGREYRPEDFGPAVPRAGADPLPRPELHRARARGRPDRALLAGHVRPGPPDGARPVRGPGQAGPDRILRLTRASSAS